MQEFWLRLISVLMIVGILFGYNAKLEERSKEEEIARLSAMVANSQDGNPANTDYKDGIYTGEADGFGGKISVEVLVEESKIKEIKVLSAESEDGAYLTMAEDIIPDIIDEQSTDVDTISGATFSSSGIRDAVSQALEKAVE